ncbi:MAG: hypothetical protein IPG06_22715 [Haliea sp.]|nr:hypothetical protein [Haliea sp.]
MPETAHSRRDLLLALQPLVALLQQELTLAGIAVPGPPLLHYRFRPLVSGGGAGAKKSVASAEAHAPMSRREVELMCRCVLSAMDLREAIGLLTDYCAMLHPRAGQVRLTTRGTLRCSSSTSHAQRGSSAVSLVDITGLSSHSRNCCSGLAESTFRYILVRIGRCSART